MKTIRNLIILALLAISFPSLGQSKVTTDKQGNYIQVATKKTNTKTGNTFTDSKGNVYDVYQSSKGNLYYNKTAKSGNIYRVYIKL